MSNWIGFCRISSLIKQGEVQDFWKLNRRNKNVNKVEKGERKLVDITLLKKKKKMGRNINFFSKKNSLN